jgi:hypothetical protein
VSSQSTQTLKGRTLEMDLVGVKVLVLFLIGILKVKYDGKTLQILDYPVKEPEIKNQNFILTSVVDYSSRRKKRTF